MIRRLLVLTMLIFLTSCGPKRVEVELDEVELGMIQIHECISYHPPSGLYVYDMECEVELE